MALTRRQLLRRAALLPLVGAVARISAGCSEGGLVCNDPELLSTPEQKLREHLAYVERSPHGEAKRCAGCHFFEAAGPGDCGGCQILNGPVNPEGHCSSWAPRA
jgi:hypothetical protein